MVVHKPILVEHIRGEFGTLGRQRRVSKGNFEAIRSEPTTRVTTNDDTRDGTNFFVSRLFQAELIF